MDLLLQFNVRAVGDVLLYQLGAAVVIGLVVLGLSKWIEHKTGL